MATNTFNPYQIIGTQLTDGLDSISKALNPSSTVDDLANEIYKYIQPIYYPGKVPTQIELEIKSVIYNIINSYNNDLLFGYNIQQLNFIGMMLGSNTTDDTPINAIGSWLSDIENNISEANIPMDKQTPLLLAIQTGISVYSYWVAKVSKPGSWASFFQTSEAINYANIPFWTVACMEGTLIGAKASNKGLIAPTTDIVSVNIISALIGALAIGAGKVIFKWVPRIQPKELIIDNETMSGGFSQVIGNETNSPLKMATNKGCTVVVPNNCNGGNCVRGCGI
jgi:hypothetical protein